MDEHLALSNASGALLSHADVGRLMHGGRYTSRIHQEGRRCCSDIELEPTITCLCRGPPSSAIRNNTIEVAIAEFAVGALNARLQSEWGQHKATSFETLLHPWLVGKSFHHIASSYLDSNTIELQLIITCDTLFPHDHMAIEDEVTYNVSIHRNLANTSLLLAKSAVARKEECFHGDCELSSDFNHVCCAQPKPRGGHIPFMHLSGFGHHATVTPLHDDCLALLARSFGQHSSSFEVVNSCSDRSYELYFRLTLKRMASSSPSPSAVLVAPNSIQFILTVWQDVYLPVKPSLLYSSEYRVLFH
jgi:hypothetical protein